jgi:deazaflavin-dependent oxidoreductase (nitroreductase family)
VRADERHPTALDTEPAGGARGYKPYPSSRRLIWLYRAPLFLWRLGLGPVVGPGLLLLTTTGRRSGRPRRAVLEYRRLDGRIFLYSGYGPHADWWRNIEADPRVTIQVGRDTLAMTARRVTVPDELATTLRRYLLAYPAVAQLYLDWAGIRTFPDDVLAHPERFYLLTFEPTTAPTPPPQQVDLAWVWPVAALLGLAGLIVGRVSRRG